MRKIPACLPMCMGIGHFKPVHGPFILRPVIYPALIAEETGFIHGVSIVARSRGLKPLQRFPEVPLLRQYLAKHEHGPDMPLISELPPKGYRLVFILFESPAFPVKQPRSNCACMSPCSALFWVSGRTVRKNLAITTLLPFLELYARMMLIPYFSEHAIVTTKMWPKDIKKIF